MENDSLATLRSMYFAAVVLPPELDAKILVYKQWMKTHFGASVGLKSPAHITIIPPYWMEAEKEKYLMHDLSVFAKAIRPFPLRTAYFSAFKPRTIFVAVEESIELQKLKQSADVFFQPKDYKMKKESRPFHPHITIATRDISKKDFAEAWPHFQHKELRDDFIADGLSLLKHNSRTWDVVFKAAFAHSS